MLILSELYLFETKTNTPYLFEALDGLDITMLSTSERVIDTLVLDEADFFFDLSARATLDFDLDRGIDDFYPEGGSKESGYTTFLQLFFYKDNLLSRNVDFDLILFEKLVSRKYSIIFKVGDTHRVMFLEFESEKTKVANLNQNSVKFKSSEGFGYPYIIQNLTVSSVTHSITCT